MSSETPFGLHFEETVPNASESPLELLYDEEEGLSYIIDPAGNRVPFVTYAASAMGETKTERGTKASIDTPDTDWVEDHWLGMGTRTVTKVAREETDRDEI